MSLTMKLNLLAQLSDFGLDPKDWQLSFRKNRKEINLIHQRDQQFQLLGFVNWKKGCWSSLTLKTSF